jgi:hypothetical protein
MIIHTQQNLWCKVRKFIIILLSTVFVVLAKLNTDNVPFFFLDLRFLATTFWSPNLGFLLKILELVSSKNDDYAQCKWCQNWLQTTAALYYQYSRTSVQVIDQKAIIYTQACIQISTVTGWSTKHGCKLPYDRSSNTMLTEGWTHSVQCNCNFNLLFKFFSSPPT